MIITIACREKTFKHTYIIQINNIQEQRYSTINIVHPRVFVVHSAVTASKLKFTASKAAISFNFS